MHLDRKSSAPVSLVGKSPPLRACIIDMNNGVPNQGIRCLRTLIESFYAHARERNPELELEIVHVEPRNLGDTPPRDCHIYLSSGGPGSPFDGKDEPWAAAYRDFLDWIYAEGEREGEASRGLFAVCFSFELSMVHFGIAKMEPRPTRKFGVMPVYMTEAGMKSDLFEPFGDRLFAWEHRSWQAVDLDARKLESLGGACWARESRDGVSKGESLLAFKIGQSIKTTLFHPEADRPGALAWIASPDQAQAVIEAYGETTYLRMLRTLDDPMRLARTRALTIPGWLARRWNAMAPLHGWREVPAPVYDETAVLREFGTPPGQGSGEPAGRLSIEPGEGG